MKRVLILVLLLMLAAPLFSAAVSYKTMGSIGKFEAEDFNGKRVNADMFKDYEVTMINFFTTSCVYCMCELQSLSDVRANMPQGGNIIAVCADGYDDTPDVEEVSRSFDYDFPLLKMTQAQLTSIPYLIGYPTSIFVDREGNILQVVTVALNHPTQMYLDTIAACLEQVRK